MNDDTLERLEVKVAFLERANVELSDEVYRQRRELDELRFRLAGLASRMEASAPEPGEKRAQDERPPHY
jgi:uncharacterized coiled-coil protein SlyX